MGEDPQDWKDIALAHGNWTWAAIQSAPDWAVERAILWADVLATVQKNASEAAKA